MPGPILVLLVAWRVVVAGGAAVTGWSWLTLVGLARTTGALGPALTTGALDPAMPSGRYPRT